MTESLRLVPGWVSSVIDPPQFKDVVRSLRKSRYHRPVPLEVTVYRGDNNQDLLVVLLVVPTCLRIVLLDDDENPEYTFEGWVVRPPYDSGGDAKVWVRCDLQGIVADGRITEGGLRVLDPGTELGVAPPPGFN